MFLVSCLSSSKSTFSVFPQTNLKSKRIWSIVKFCCLFSGVRKCNASLVDDPILKLTPLIFTRNHPIYQKIIYESERDRILMPDHLSQLLSVYVSGSRTGTSGKYQGGDALLEELNKESKSWLKMAGIPKEEKWLRVFRNIDNLNKVI